ncbi:hypothetical protein B0T22DRAFT_64227 [Podospora appendiculata]|uniref:TFIIS N-terminal domain-containing protein n=1 Tax=Podospora appendiculata TaxID=314037 RepID=A0AAE0XJ37_9PEZI|nr:hypothetical protein B0T22DRAFT_64227 [Podospora appendiculata]
MSDAGSTADEPIQRHEGGGDDADNNAQDEEDFSDKDSDLLSEIDEDQFDDYDPTAERPVDIDENVASTLKAAKRKRTDVGTAKKPKEGRRPRKRARANDEVEGGDADDGDRRPRKSRVDGERRTAARKEAPQREEPEENLTPEERRRRALDRAMDAAVKNPIKRRRKKDEIDLEEEIDDQIASLKVSMEKACVADNEAREKGQPAVHKLKLLPQVTALLNRTAIQDSVLDPETNFLQSVKYFLEPLNDGSLPAYNIQRDIFTALAKLPVGKDSLLSSGIGKVVLFYTKSKRPEVGIKRIAERLMGEWSRPILKRTDDYKKRHVETREFDYSAAKTAQQQEAATGHSQMTLTQRPAGKTRYELERERQLAPEPLNSNRARPAGLPASYTIAPRSTFDGTRDANHRPIGSGGLEAFRKMTQKGKGKRS